MKKLVSAFLFLFVTLLTAQETKHLTLEDAVLANSKELVPTPQQRNCGEKEEKGEEREKKGGWHEDTAFSLKKTQRKVIHLEALTKESYDRTKLPHN